MALEAQERSKPILLCQKCFSLIPDGAEYCPECGAPVVDDLVEGSDTAVYPELARANLLRMRGEYKQAEDICLAILRRHPNSSTANTLLGDICAERGDLKQAAEWYEMALDITPDSASDRQKLESVRARIKDHETAQTAKTLGLPESRPKVGIWVGGAVVFILLIAAVAFLLGERTNARRTSPNREVLAPVTVPLDSSRDASNPTEKANLEAKSDQAATPGDLLSRIRTAVGSDPSRILAAGKFADTSDVFLMFTVSGSEDARRMAADFGKVALGEAADASEVQLTVYRGNKLVFAAAMTRERLQAASTEEWKAANANDPNAFANATLTNEWPAPAVPAPNPANSGDGGTPPG